jgi:hypothetical protein
MIGTTVVFALWMSEAGLPGTTPEPQPLLLAAEPEPAPTEIVQLAPPPEAEPPPPPHLVQLVPPPQEEPPPQGERQRGEARPCEARFPPFMIHGHAFTSRWIDRTLHGVIANRCQSKTYRDILSLDGGTVGISHFASGSLLTLYRQMDTRRYFGEHARHIPDRPYRLAWWREGMARFLRSREARPAQQRAWRAYIRPALRDALAHGWSSDRALAIAAGIANSLGAFGFHQLAAACGWDAERALLSYARRSPHKERRRQRLDREFPPGR